jgi:hypothetical protein
MSGEGRLNGPETTTRAAQSTDNPITDVLIAGAAWSLWQPGGNKIESATGKPPWQSKVPPGSHPGATGTLQRATLGPPECHQSATDHQANGWVAFCYIISAWHF